MKLALTLWMLGGAPLPPALSLAPPDTRAASEAFARGVEAFSAGDFSSSAGHFAEANAILSHPSTLVNLAISLEELGDVSGGWWVLSDSAIFDVQASTEALDAARAALEARLFVLEFETGEDAVVCVDDVAIPATLPGRYRIGLRPGPHTVRIDGLEVSVAGDAGTSRVYGFEHAEALMLPNQRESTVWLAGTAGGLAALSGGLALGAHGARRRDALRGALSVGAAISAAAASGIAIAIAARAGRSPEAQRRAERRRRRDAEAARPCVPFQDPRDEGRPSGLPLEGVGPSVSRPGAGSGAGLGPELGAGSDAGSGADSAANAEGGDAT